MPIPLEINSLANNFQANFSQGLAMVALSHYRLFPFKLHHMQFSTLFFLLLLLSFSQHLLTQFTHYCMPHLALQCCARPLESRKKNANRKKTVGKSLSSHLTRGKKPQIYVVIGFPLVNLTKKLHRTTNYYRKCCSCNMNVRNIVSEQQRAYDASE